MATYRALIVEDNLEIVEVVQDTLRSLGHDFDTATCQQEARQLLAEKQHDYYLLDLEIPVQAEHSLARIQNGENLLREIIGRRGRRHAPIIIMTSHGTNGPQLAVRMMKLGASDYVTKPFDTVGKTLDNAILEALAKGGPIQNPSDRHVSSDTWVPFEGGKLVFFRDRVELCGVVVVEGDVRTRQILDRLKQRRPKGRYVAYSGGELAEELEILGGQNAVAEAVKDFRDQVGEALGGQGRWPWLSGPRFGFC